jgi:hypothetical protein
MVVFFNPGDRIPSKSFEKSKMAKTSPSYVSKSWIRFVRTGEIDQKMNKSGCDVR